MSIMREGARHLLTNTTYQLRKLVEEQKWFDRYLFGAGR